MELDAKVQKYAEQIQHEINCNQHLDTGGLRLIRRGWETKTDEVLFEQLLSEVEDLQKAIYRIRFPVGGDPKNAPSPQFIGKHAADIGALAMMVSDVSGGLEVA